MNLPKILIAAPTASIKYYCFEEWIDNIMQFTYPNFQVRIFDNTPDNGLSVIKQNRYFHDKYGENNDKFLCISSLKINGIDKRSVTTTISRMAMSHNDCREYALENKFDAMLHLETDIFPEKDIIEKLLEHKKQVIGAVYFIDEGRWRKPMIQRHLFRSPNNIVSAPLDSNDISFIDGSVKKVSSVGLGCVLIDRKVLQKIPFRFIKGAHLHPDSYFSEDCFKNKIPTFVNTSTIARHDNKFWGIYGKDYN